MEKEIDMKDNTTRIYNNITNIDSNNIKAFWNNRAKAANNLNGVLLGEKFGRASGDLRNIRECAILKEFLPNNRTIDILDIGCGMGRWAANLHENTHIYHGIDFSEEFVNKLKNIYFTSESKKFFVMSATDIDKDLLLERYDLVIITGVMMYINDGCLDELFCKLRDLVKPQGIFYLQESISIMDDRLTLKDFLSDELHCNYSAIYRTSSDYESYIKQYLAEFTVLKTDPLLDEQTGAREETNARYWVLQKK